MYKTLCFFAISALLIPSVSFATNFGISEYNVRNKSVYVPVVYIANNYVSITVPAEEALPAAEEEEDKRSTVEKSTEPKAYRLRMKLEENGLNFSLTEAIPIPNYEYYLNTLQVGSKRADVTETLGTPTEIINMTYKSKAMGPAPINLTENTPYEEWQYIVDGMVYVVWFAATSDVPQEDWIMQGVTSYEVDVTWGPEKGDGN